MRSVNSISLGLLPQFFWCEVSNLIRSNVLWNITKVDKAFCKSTNGSFGKNIIFRKHRSKCRVSVYFSKTKTLPLPWLQLSNLINLSPENWLTTQGMLPYQGFSVVSPADRLTLNSGHSQVRLGNLKSMLLNPGITFIPATLFTGCWVMTVVAVERGRLASTECATLSTWWLKTSSAELTPRCTFSRNANFFRIFTNSEWSIHFWWISWQEWRKRHISN